MILVINKKEERQEEAITRGKMPGITPVYPRCWEITPVEHCGAGL
jgi:hypothetical protein